MNVKFMVKMYKNVAKYVKDVFFKLLSPK